jgi:tetratricopeptide (TPR) repeat protein
MRPLGIVHRDVSPQNVLLSFEGEVKVTDFGIAKARRVLEADAMENTQSRRLHGKFGYMSPEQARGDEVDAPSDLFSLGTVLYECVAGMNPFTAPTVVETLERVAACRFPPIEEIRQDVPPELAAIIKTAMAGNPGDRYADAGRMYESLLAILYAQGSRYGAHDLAEFVGHLREPIDGSVPPSPTLDIDVAAPAVERTPVEVPSTRHVSNVSGSDASAHIVDGSHEPPVEAGEPREVTVLFLDLPRSTSDVVVGQAIGTIERWGGVIMRRDEAQLAALFGLDDTDGRDTEMATRCALALLRDLGPGRPTGAGLHTGHVLLASGGRPMTDGRLAELFDVALELARVRSSGVAISVPAMRQIKSLFEFESPGEMDHPASAVSCVIVSDRRGPGESLGRFVGRRDELRRIGEVLARASRRRAQVLTVRGDRGVGKSRLVCEVERRLQRRGQSVGFHVATCPPRGTESPLFGIVCMLQVLCGTADNDTQERVLDVQPRLRALGLPGDELHAVLVALGADLTPLVGDGPTLLRQAFTRIVHSLCDDRPHCFAWDEAHAMDSESFAVLGHVLDGCAQARAVFMFAARAGFSHPLEARDSHVSLELGDLAPDDVERLVASRLGVGEVPDELLKFVRSRAAGHPLFVEEVVKALVDVGAVSIAERRVVSLDLVGHDLDLPKTLRGLLDSRLARLSNADHEALRAAAVLGDGIQIGVLSEMIGRAMPALEQSIATLSERGFLSHASPRELRFSPSIRETILDALTPESSRALHLAAARALEATLGERAVEQASRMASHMSHAGEPDRAASYFAISAARHLETSQFDAAAKDYTRAIELADADRPAGELARWLDGLAAAMHLVRTAPRAPQLCARVIEREDRSGDRAWRVRARVAAGRVLAAVHLMDESRQRLAEAESIADGDEQLLRITFIAGADLATLRGDYKRVLDLLGQLQPIASDDRERLHVALHLARAHAGLGDRKTALELMEESSGLVPNDPVVAMDRARTRAIVDYLTRDFHSAVDYFSRAVDMGRQLDVTHVVLVNLSHLGEALVRVGDLPRAYGALRQSLALCEQLGDARFANRNSMVLAFLDWVKDAGDSEKRIREGIEYAESKAFTTDVIRGRLLLAHGLARQGQVDAARREYDATRALAADAGQRLAVDDCDEAIR